MVSAESTNLNAQADYNLSSLNYVFGNIDYLLEASPLTHVTGKHPPFLIAYADKDIDRLDQSALDMAGALTDTARA